jgi:hypothetical protein
MADFATTPNQITAEQLTDYLTRAGQLSNGGVRDFDFEVIGTGKMGDNARFTLRYNDQAAAGPASLIAKFPAADEQARSMAGAQGAYYNEVMFYRELAPDTRMRTPVIYGSELSEDRTSFLLLMEDMTPAVPGSQLQGETRERTVMALAEAAKLAADYYGKPGLAERDYVMSSLEDGGAFGQALMEQYWPGFVDRFGHGLSEECIAFGERFARNYAYFVTRLQAPRTLAHGDFRSENILFGADCATIVDWQTTGHSSVLTDAAYFLGGSVDVADRRDWEKQLIEEYRNNLEDAGVALPFQECWNQYREYAMHGLMITVLGASFTSPEERSDKMFLAMIQRHLQQCVDMDSGEFLP